MDYVKTLVRVHRLGRAMHPSFTLNSMKHQVYLIFRSLLNINQVRQWFEIDDSPVLKSALERFPLISGAIYWPYINYTWTITKKLAVIDQHYRMLDGSVSVIRSATIDEVELAKIDSEFTGLRLVLDKAFWFLREGEVVLNIYENNNRLYSIAITLGIENGKPLVYLGAIQGSNTEIAKDTYREITHALHGMRPRDFLMVALKLLCSEFKINKIWAVSSEYRQHNSPYFGGGHKQKVLAPYNEVWQEHGGIYLGNGFYEIDTQFNKKEMSEIPVRKRASYRRRYQMLDKLSSDIKTNCAIHAQTYSEKNNIDKLLHISQSK